MAKILATSQPFNVHGVKYCEQTGIRTAESLAHETTSSEAETAIQSLKGLNHKV
jgi:hypothetical protein